MTPWCGSRRIFPRATRSIEGQGNFGNIDGDSAAAYRYTEARMTDVARLLLEGIDEDAIDFRDNYSGDQKEPIVLPAALPNLLANGAQGIAVGMATSIPPHNLAELCDAALYLISHPKALSDQLMAFVPGPDFPTGGIIVDPPEALAETYRTRTRLVPRSRPLEQGGRGARHLGRGRDRNPLYGAEVAAHRKDSPSFWPRRSCRSSPTCATNRPRTCASSSSRAHAASIPPS